MIVQINIIGGAYLKVLKPDLVIIYTLGRQFHTDNTGIIITPEGYILLGPLIVPAPLNEPLEISEEGLVKVFIDGTWASIGQIGATVFERPELLNDFGDGYFGESDGSGVPLNGNPGGSGPFQDVKTYGFVQWGSHERPLAVLNINKLRKIADFIAAMHGISLNMANHPELFPNPNPSLVTFNTNISALEAAEAITATRVRGSVQARDEKYDVVVDNVHGLLNYVQDLADYSANIDAAKTLIIASGFELKSTGTHSKDDLEAKQGEPSGTIILTAKAVSKAGAYEWQMSLNGTVWTSLPTTIAAHTSVKGLTLASLVHFRSRPVKPDTVSSWCQPVSIIVI